MLKDFMNISNSISLKNFLKNYESEILSYSWYTVRVKSVCNIEFKDGSKGIVSL